MLAGESFPAVSRCIGKTLVSDAGRLQLVDVLGEGAYGVVYLAVQEHGGATSSKMSSPRQFAVKVLQKATNLSREGQCQSREIMTHKIASGHPNVLTLHDVLEDEEHLYLVLDYCPGGDLYSAIVERHMYARNDALVRSVFVQILDAVQSCHDHGIYHRDLKPDNILVSADGSRVYLGDFGLATDQEVSTNFCCGSRFYLSPGKYTITFPTESTLTMLSTESIGEERGRVPFSNEISDIWALGIIFANLISGRNPWRRATTDDLHFHRYMSNGDSLGEMLPISKTAVGILQRVFTFNPAERISIAELREEVLRADTFFLTDKEIAAASSEVQSAAAQYTPLLPQGDAVIFPTPELPSATFESMHHFPDENYIFCSPNPDYDSPISTPSSDTTAHVLSTLFSDSCTLYSGSGSGDSSVDKGKAVNLDFAQKDNVAQAKLGAPQVGHRLLAKLLA